jgi:hypothetical protein
MFFGKMDGIRFFFPFLFLSSLISKSACQFLGKMDGIRFFFPFLFLSSLISKSAGQLDDPPDPGS